jgi:hypothetical protein
MIQINIEPAIGQASGGCGFSLARLIPAPIARLIAERLQLFEQRISVSRSRAGLSALAASIRSSSLVQRPSFARGCT